MPVLSFGPLFKAAVGYGDEKEKAKAEELKRMYTADYTRYLRDKTAYEADVQRQRDAALLSADQALKNPTLAAMLRASAGKDAAKIAGLSQEWAWQQKAAQTFGQDPNKAAFFANLGGRSVDPLYDVKNDTIFGRYTGQSRPTQLGQAAIQERKAAAQKNLAEALRASMQPQRPAAKKGQTLTSAIIQYVQETLPAYAGTLFQSRFEGEDIPDDAAAWATNRALGLIQQGVPVDQAIQRAADEAARRSVLEKGLFNDSVRFQVQTQTEQPPLPPGFVPLGR